MLPKFELYMPDTLEEACRLKAEGAEVVAGGTDVFVNMHGGKDRSGKVVDIKNIPALQGHTFDGTQGPGFGRPDHPPGDRAVGCDQEALPGYVRGLLPGGLRPDPHPGDPGGQHLQRRALGGQHRPHAGPRRPGGGGRPRRRAGGPPPRLLSGPEEAGPGAGRAAWPASASRRRPPAPAASTSSTPAGTPWIWRCWASPPMWSWRART